MPKGIPNKRYTGEFKQKVIETMHEEQLSFRETARQFEISDHTRVLLWERIYLEEGPEGLYIERKGRLLRKQSLCVTLCYLLHLTAQ